MEFERIRFENNASARLSRSHTASEKVLVLEPGGGARFPSVWAGQWFPVTVEDASGQLETMRCIARDGDQLSVERGQEGSTARAFAIGSQVELRLTRRVLGVLSDDLGTIERWQAETRGVLATKADKASTLAGYGIEDGASKAELSAVRQVAEAALPQAGGEVGKLRAVSVEGAIEQTADIGNSFDSWTGPATATVQVNCPRPNLAYFAIRWTQWGWRHLGAISCYAGGDNQTAPRIVFSIGNQAVAWEFTDGSITNWQGHTVLRSPQGQVLTFTF